MKETLIEYIKRIMRQKNLTLRDIEDNSDGEISNSYISKILNGRVENPTADKILALARGLRVDPHEVFATISGKEQAGINPMVFADIVQQLASDPSLVEFCQELLQMPAEERAIMIHSLHFVNTKRKKGRKKKKR